jgi:hypothetical protein
MLSENILGKVDGGASVLMSGLDLERLVCQEMSALTNPSQQFYSGIEWRAFGVSGLSSHGACTDLIQSQDHAGSI